MRARTRSALAALPMALALLLAGCGSDADGGDGDEVASANEDDTQSDGDSDDGGDAGEGGGEPLTEDKIHEQLLAYAQCLRDNGLDVEDPAPGEGIQLRVEGEPGQADPALEACEDVAPPPPPGIDEGEEREEMLAFAECMRENGVEKFPDPKPGEGIGIGPEVAEDPDFAKAEETCDQGFSSDRQESNA